MNNINIIYQCFDSDKTLLEFPYPPMYKEEHADYICFVTNKEVNSKYWKVIYVQDYSNETISVFLDCYSNKVRIETNQIQTGSLFDESCDEYESLITIPQFSELPDISFDTSKLVSTCDNDGKYIYKKNPVYTDGKYNGRPLLLTIGVPVSNQIETIDRCLSHIKPLLDEVESELLVIDTGSTDGTIEVCKKYGARIVDFPWCDNMSAARNTGIYNAKGLWYMSIDDDEWFEDVSEIVAFFKSGVYRMVDMASYVQHNYKNSKGGVYTDVSALRMARITPELHFEGRIHDALAYEQTSEIKIYNFKAYTHHYGFVRDNMEKLRKKYRRNVTILLNDLYEYPTNLRYNFQLANELGVIGHYKEATAYFWRGLSIEKHLGSNVYGKIHAAALIMVAYNSNSEKIFKLCDLFEDKYEFSIAEKAYFCYGKADMGLKHRHCYEEVLWNIKEYWQYIALFQKNPMEGAKGAYTGVHVCSNKEYVNDAHVMMFCVYMGLGLEKEAEQELPLININDIYAMHNEFYEHIYMGDGTIFRDIIEKYLPMERETMADMFIYGYMRYVCKSEEQCDFNKFAELLSYFSVRSIQKVLDIYKKDIKDEFWIKAGSVENIYAAESIRELPLQVKYVYSYILKKKYMEEDNHVSVMDAFLKYMHVASDFAQDYYSVALLESDSVVVEPEFRAAYFIWHGCNETNITRMILLLKKGLSICPAFYEEIRNLLQVINVTV